MWNFETFGVGKKIEKKKKLVLIFVTSPLNFFYTYTIVEASILFRMHKKKTTGFCINENVLAQLEIDWPTKLYVLQVY